MRRRNQRQDDSMDFDELNNPNDSSRIALVNQSHT